MKIAKMLLTTSIIAGTATAAQAQGRPFTEVDTDGNGTLSLSELEAVFGAASAARILARADRNQDGVLTMSEVTASNNASDDDEEDDQESDDQGDEEDDQESDEQSDEEDDDENDEEDDDQEDDDEEDDE